MYEVRQFETVRRGVLAQVVGAVLVSMGSISLVISPVSIYSDGHWQFNSSEFLIIAGLILFPLGLFSTIKFKKNNNELEFEVSAGKLSNSEIYDLGFNETEVLKLELVEISFPKPHSIGGIARKIPGKTGEPKG